LITRESPDDIYVAMLDTNSMLIGLYDLYVVATDEHGNAAESSRVQVSVLDPLSPIVTITSPTKTFFGAGANITFTGEATDTDGEDLTPNLEWESDPDGPLGTGGTVITSSLTVGTHHITASVTNSQGHTGSETITVVVTEGGGCKTKGCK
jgi:hypothetical protein